jgi:hypothetical protein
VQVTNICNEIFVTFGRIGTWIGAVKLSVFRNCRCRDVHGRGVAEANFMKPFWPKFAYKILNGPI